jgi:transposase, IS5 family
MKRKAHFQGTLAAQTGFEKYARKSRREEFLSVMNAVVPWSELEALIEPHYPKAGNGRQPVGLSIMLRVYFLQQWFNLSDPGAEDALYESPVLRHFVGVDLGRAAAPDETTILRFRRLLEEHELCGKILDTVNHYLASKGLRISTGTIIAAPSSTRNRESARDPETHQTRKGKQWHFGAKAHIGVDSKENIVHSVSDVHMFPDLLHRGAVRRRHYFVFMAANKVEVISCKADDEKTYKWTSVRQKQASAGDHQEVLQSHCIHHLPHL